MEKKLMKSTLSTGIFKLDNGCFGYRYTSTSDGKRKDVKRTTDDNGKPFKTEKAAVRARASAIASAEIQKLPKPKKRKTLSDVYTEYSEYGRAGKAYATIRKQDSLWENHIKPKFGSRYVDSITVAEVNDYLEMLYFEEERAYGYVEGFLKMFYLIFGQAYSRNYLDVDVYNKLCVNKDIRIHMPKMKIDEEHEVVVFSRDELAQLDEYFKDSNAETAYLIGRYCGLRINECYGLKWIDIDFSNNCIHVERQMQYQEGVIKLVPLKTRNARRTVYMNEQLKAYLMRMKQQTELASEELSVQRTQNQRMITDIDGSLTSSCEMVNTLENGKLQTVNSMKYHAKTIREKFGITFKYHYLRHTYGTRLAELNTPAHILCRQMGHGNSKVTEQYYLALSQDGVDALRDKLNQI